MVKILEKIFGTKNERELKRYFTIVEDINRLESQISSLSDEKLKQKTDEFRERLAKGESLDDILKEAFAVVREVAKRTLGMRHFDVQLVGGLVLHEGKIAEMKTGEGKTLVATLAAYLNALEGKGVHIVTVNDYLARRDVQWMGAIYNFLGLSVGVIQPDASFLYDPNYRLPDRRFDRLRPCSKKEAYLADITYGTNNEFGFDYLRDNMRYSIDELCQRELNYAIVDEVDSILIDEARTPLIISGPSEESTDIYYAVNRIIKYLKPENDFKLDEKLKTVVLTEQGSQKAEKLLGIDNLYNPSNIQVVHHINQAIRAHYFFKKEVDYVVKDGKIVIVDEFTGRLLEGRRWSDGLHQAIEAKEGLKIEAENQTLATITFQNYFRMYKKLAGMTGTADTEASEFAEIYNLEVVVIPTHKPMIREDYPDAVYKTEKAKYEAVVKEIEECYKVGRPVLVGTTSIEKSELISKMLKKKGVPHNVLNAKYHDKEAEIVAQAGRIGAVTIATNMAGRGTDILLGGNPEFLAREMLAGKDYTEEEYKKALEKAKEICKEEHDKVVSLGGLHIIGTERHESRRIDNQLRGRAGRQGDPGSSRFYLSLEDELLRLFGGERLQSLMHFLKIEDDTPIENKMVSKAIENAQKRVEAHNFDIRKHLLKYDDVMNSQRNEIYSFRKEVLESDSLKDKVFELLEIEIDEMVDFYLAQESEGVEKLKEQLSARFDIEVDLSNKSKDEIKEYLLEKLREAYEKKEQKIGQELMRDVEKMIFLHVIDTKWKDHLLGIDHIKEGIGLRGYAQRDPLVEYKKEAFELFEEMSRNIISDILTRLFKIQIKEESQVKVARAQKIQRSDGDGARRPVEKPKKIGRNDPCPCGSGKKYKKCCGKNS
ncbi:preprotein translocase subunit SecA [Thermodesulfovibrio yellowstonii]|uniref:Protein translocase subunit SecA n=1 Tax=Thermodesulfovibrio yellowstonii (strain ATCC 51303 / DSM 11347 / YP87) TaxID=289376 RepID=SECA_THEYD|nr:preprotein translocase subunit SecA [Thermodesulfovibrio yellowstonii]B5YKT5.1 RecName: Full=Protein translocase subunit SecA [Thermodesulfovibrio yellowstonii DSM 11347]ACI20371.1 preprotein translocase, SecA subunit [Thermodesulfovibrio yellowstonii DSM 11347]